MLKSLIRHKDEKIQNLENREKDTENELKTLISMFELVKRRLQ